MPSSPSTPSAFATSKFVEVEGLLVSEKDHGQDAQHCRLGVRHFQRANQRLFFRPVRDRSPVDERRAVRDERLADAVCLLELGHS